MCISPTLAQRLNYGEAKVDKEQKLLYIPYTLKESTKFHNLYGISIFYTQDKGKTYFGPLQNVEGDVGQDITPGEKLIVWDYLQEDSLAFTGQNVSFKIQLTARPDPRYLPGPEAVLYSLILPGLGQREVKPPSRFWPVHTVGVYGFLGAGVLMRIKSNQTRDQYLQSNTINEAQSLFDKSNRQRTFSGSFFVAAGAWWLADMAWVFFGQKKPARSPRTGPPPRKNPKTRCRKSACIWIALAPSRYGASV
ncbi:MAG: hypothetical protein HC913_10825 [Microscillaceae bacterium]|nr:hypothetical protein [Microscillaceae bacterium]